MIRSGLFARVALAMAVMAVALRVLVPAGYMPGGPGESAIVLCTAQGLQSVVVDHAARGPSNPADDRSGEPKTDHPCAFAGLAQAFAPTSPAAFTPAGWTVAAAPQARAPDAAPGRGLAAPPPPATGPPLEI